MYTIYVDTSDRYNSSVTLFKDKQVVKQVTGELDVVATIKALLAETHLQPKDIQLYQAFPGPGSFTGLKKAFAITNALNWAVGNIASATDFELPDYGKEPNIG